MGIVEDLAAILNARFGYQVRQAIHDSISDINDIAMDAKSSAETSQTSASASAAAALASQQAAAQSAAQAMSGTPEGYADFVSNTNSSLDYLAETGCKNILENKASTGTDSGITFTVNSDGSVTLNGTATAIVVFRLTGSGTTDYSKYGRLKLSGCPSGLNGSAFLRVYNNGSAIGNDEGAGITFNGNTQMHISIVVTSGTTLNNVVFKPMLTLASTPNSDYAHYVPYAQTNVALTKNMDVLSVQHFDTKINNASTQSILDYFTTENGHSYLIELNTFVDTGDVASLYVLTIYSNGTVTNVSAIHEGTGNACPVIDANKVLKLRNTATAFTCHGTVFQLW